MKTAGGDIMSSSASDFARCDCNAIHEDVIDMVRLRLPENEKLFYLADPFRYLPTLREK